MKLAICVLSCVLFSASAYAGIFRNAAEPAGKASAKVLSYSARKAAQGTKRAAKTSGKVVAHSAKLVKRAAY